MDAETYTDDIPCSTGSLISKKGTQTVLEALVDNFARLKAENVLLREQVRRVNYTVSLFMSQRSTKTLSWWFSSVVLCHCCYRFSRLVYHTAKPTGDSENGAS